MMLGDRRHVLAIICIFLSICFTNSIASKDNDILKNSHEHRRVKRSRPVHDHVIHQDIKALNVCSYRAQRCKSWDGSLFRCQCVGDGCKCMCDARGVYLCMCCDAFKDDEDYSICHQEDPHTTHLPHHLPDHHSHTSIAEANLHRRTVIAQVCIAVLMLANQLYRNVLP